MNVDDAQDLARCLMNEHGLVDWKFKFDNAKKRFGQCDLSTNTISISFYLTILNDEVWVRDTILHEIAHALVGPAHGHDSTWQWKAVTIGANGDRTYDSTVIKSPNGRWIAHCPLHGDLNRSKPRHRRTSNLVCRRCRRPIEWRERN